MKSEIFYRLNLVFTFGETNYGSSEMRGSPTDLISAELCFVWFIEFL
jgi:hypothetical protein